MYLVLAAAALLLPLAMPNGGALGLLAFVVLAVAVVALFNSTQAEGLYIFEVLLITPFMAGVVVKSVWLLVLRARREIAEEKRSAGH